MTDHDSDHDTRLSGGLGDLATRVPLPEVAVADDVARGRRRVRRNRLLTAGAVVVTVVAVGAGAGVAPSLLHADGGPGYSRRSHAPSVSRSATPTPSPEPEAVTIEPSQGSVPFPFSAGTSPKETGRTLAQWQDVLAEHLDPHWEHLVKYDARTNGNVQTGTTGSAITSLGSKYGWQVAGQPGLGMLQVSVDAGWKQLMWDCGVPSAGWQCRDATGPAGEPAKVAEHDGVLEAAVEHGDGEVVVLTADSLFGNNSTVAVSGMDVTEKDLLTAAADRRLALPGGVPSMPPAISRTLLEQVGRQLLAGPGESLSGVQGGGGTSAWMQADWTDPGGRAGRLDWSVVPHVGDHGDDYSCLSSQFRSCSLEPVAGRRVFIGRSVARAGGGWQVAYAGPAYTVLVSFRPDGARASFPLERAEALVLDDRLQPAT